MRQEAKTKTKMPSEFGIEDRSYRLKGKAAPLEYILPTRNTNRFPLLHYMESEKINRSLRYSRNQMTPFEDEQDEHAIIQPVIFENGFLNVPKTDPLLQWFLDIHPLKDKTFEMVNKRMEAARELEIMDIQDRAEATVKEMTKAQLRDIAMIIFSHKAKVWSDEDVYLQMRKHAKKDPNSILRLMEDPDVESASMIYKFFQHKLLELKFGTQLHINTKESNEKICDIPKKSGKSKEEHAMEFLKSEDGLIYLTTLENALDELITK